VGGASVAGDLAAAFGHTFWWVLGVGALAVLPALALPRSGPEPAAQAGAERSGEAPAEPAGIV
jgi:hypothetical protein